MIPRVVFMGSDGIAAPLLSALHRKPLCDTLHLVGVVSQPDRPHGRGQRLTANPVAARAREAGLPVLTPEKPGTETIDWLRELGAEWLLVMAYGHLLSAELLACSRLPPLNFHASLLPAYRGASPVAGALAAGEKTTGITLMRIVKRLDAGPMYDREVVSIPEGCEAPQLYELLAGACLPLAERALPAIIEGRLVEEPQEESRATFTRLIEKADAALDFRLTARELAARVAALQPWPGAQFEMDGTIVKVAGARVVATAPTGTQPGSVLKGTPAHETLWVACGEGVIEFSRLQRPGGKWLGAADFLRGFGLAHGTILRSTPGRPLWSREPFLRSGGSRGRAVGGGLHDARA